MNMPSTTCSITDNPTFRTACLNTVAIVPLLSSDDKLHTHSRDSFEQLFTCLAPFAADLRQASGHANQTNELTLIVPNNNLTRPGEWKYDSTPLKSHDWSMGYQRMVIFDGREYDGSKGSVHSQIRLSSFHQGSVEKGEASYSDFVDLYPSRGISAVIGVLNLRDCTSTADLHDAEKELESWTRRYTPNLYGQNVNTMNEEDNPIHPSHFVTQRMFVFDSCDDTAERKAVDLSQTKLYKFDQIVAFPPIENMDMHLNVVINNLAVAMLQSLERRIKALDSKDGLRRKGIGLASAVKALNKQSTLSTDKAFLSKVYQLTTPIDPPTVNVSDHLSSKEIDHLVKRNSARREKYSADLALLAGSPLDAYDRYTRAAEYTKSVHDYVWYAACLEGMATSFVAMADCGGHGADSYLENNFQYPGDIMANLLAESLSTAEDSDKKEKVDKSKTTMPAAIYALVEEAAGIFNRKIYSGKLSSICSELLLKTAWYVAELEGLHVRCQWGRGFVSDMQRNIPAHLLTASGGTYSNRCEMTSVSKLDIQNMKKKDNHHAVLGSSSLEQCQRFTELMHRCISCRLDPYTKTFVAAWCTRLSLLGIRVPIWNENQSEENTFNRLPMPRKAAFFAKVAADSSSICKGFDKQLPIAKLWTASSSLYSNEGNSYLSKSRYGWSTIRAWVLHDVSQEVDGKHAEKAMQELLSLLSEISLDCRNSSRNLGHAMKDISPKMGVASCQAAQIQCIDRLIEVRHSIPVTSKLGREKSMSSNNETPELSPLSIRAATIVKSEPHLILHRIKAAGFTSKDALSTFFNPYANKKNDETDQAKIQSILVAEGEERTIEIEFSNSLSVPLFVAYCKLQFDCRLTNVDVEAPPLSFTIPEMSKSFKVHFPFTVAPSKWDSRDSRSMLPLIDVIGLKASCFNRSFEYRFDGQNIKGTAGSAIAPAAWIYQRSLHHTKTVGIDKKVVRLETVPAQPNLLVSFATSPTPLDDAVVPVHLSDGEIYTIPAFRLENDFGTSGCGRMERLQIVGVGLPGLPEEILFDTDELAKALEEKEDTFQSDDDSETFEELMESDGLPPLKMKCVADGLSLKSINDKSKSLGEGSCVTFQIAATHDMGNQLANGGNVRIRFRYRGASLTDGVEIWRKREIALRIVRIKGPRISSLTMREDLSWGSAFSDLCWSLAIQRKQMEKIPNWETSQMIHRTAVSEDEMTRADSILSHDIGLVPNDLNKGTYVSRDDIVVLMAVANETNSTITLRNRSGKVGGLDESNPMHTVKVTSGVSVKIPVVIPRIHCIGEDGDVATELIARTALTWESVAVETGDTAIKRTRHGRVRVPSRCLREIMDEHRDFATRCHKPPLSIEVRIEGEESPKHLTRFVGSPVDCIVSAQVQSWVSSDDLSSCSLTMEFAAALQNSAESEESFTDAYSWCGQVRKTVQANEVDLNHNARICFFRPGTYVLSACVKMCGLHTEEVWWSPTANIIKVERKGLASSIDQ